MRGRGETEMARATLEIAITFETVTCCHSGCGITFAVPDWWVKSRRTDHQRWYCPSGHAQHFSGQTDDERRIAQLQAELADERRFRGWEEDRRKRAESDAMNLANSNRALRGVATKLKKRASAGVCAYCNRTFINVTRHVASKHPEHGHPKALGEDVLAAKMAP